ncbi:TPA: glycosyltransferase family 2 protein [Streptococcus pneumoniae]|uniref:Glycosyltransferase n=2 Tax=Streptococcus pneumoniae TaxID=1313 RepID=A0A6G2D4I4_STREE|nr:glycosyltransferase [Streptococcus pneumoniae]EJG38385.1 glycosyl transferase family 2 family protein [Streptococcus pneumoniae 2090008]EJG58900.1 glycosyl transferase family 2 family protein [Streptococcus pneumoniae 2061376]EOB18187.1 glycosyl transferase family protein [Streptococcus pneumoniae 2009]EJH06739.1 putative glycosyl transferase [Streptococcus pneumoniae GA56348]EJH24864.1 putative glycosyl transferase [Streptococcus pneumoniae GA58981]
MNFCFVILHYRTSNDTIECIKSIQKLEGDYKIVIVDNASQNGSIERVEALFANNDEIVIIKNTKNLGFAAGNNIGYAYARTQIKADMIAVLNNDIVIKQKDFINRIFELYRNSQFHIAGPDIVSLVDGHHQSPVVEKINSISKANKELFKYRILRIINKIGLYELMTRQPKKELNRISVADPMRYQENVILHGSFVIFSPLYVSEEECAFRPDTFMYMEEPILYEYCMLKNYKTVFDPSIVIYHKEDSSTNSLYNAAYAKREFVFKNMIRSLKIYRSLLK